VGLLNISRNPWWCSYSVRPDFPSLLKIDTNVQEWSTFRFRFVRCKEWKRWQMPAGRLMWQTQQCASLFGFKGNEMQIYVTEHDMKTKHTKTLGGRGYGNVPFTKVTHVSDWNNWWLCTWIHPATEQFICSVQWHKHSYIKTVARERAHHQVHYEEYIESNSVITPWKGLTILCRYKRVLLYPRSVMLRLTVRN
jgi:hypothetical protein